MQIPSWTAPVLLLLFVLPAQDAPRVRAESAPTRTEKFVLDPGKHSVSDLITRSGDFLGRTYLFNVHENPAFEQSHVDLPRRLELDAHGCEEVVGHLLYSMNYAMTPLDADRGIYEWIFLPGARRMEIKKRALFVPWDQLLARPNLKTYVMTSFPLKHIDANRATNTVRPMMQMDQSGMDTMTALGNTNSVMITGFRETVAASIKMLMLADVPAPRIEAGLEERLQRVEARLQAIEEALKKK